jgi:fructosamine-3-kinase
MFDCEAAGLHILADTKTIKVPEVLGSGQSEPFGWLLLSYIESGTKDNRFFSLLGSQLADLHKTSNPSFGFGQHNYIGSLRQNNNYHSGFGEFFISERIEPQLKTAIDNGLIGRGLIKNFEAMFRQLNSLLPAEPPALLHGDLWNGNVMCDSKSNPVLIDPAVYFGHREADIAMTRLFGGFPEEFYSSYNECFPLTKNWQNRTDIFNLYPLLVHVNLFGQGYTGDVLRIIRRF